MTDYRIRELAAEHIIDIGKRMVDRGYVVANDGNLSVRLGPDRVLATPTGVSKGRMHKDMLSVLDLDGNVIEEGTERVSSEVRMHLRVYRENPLISAVVHAHPVTATSFAAAGIALDQSILTESVTAVGSIPVARFAVPGTDDVGDAIAPFCNAYNGVLLANHGVVAWANDLETAFFRLEWIEMLAKSTLITKYILGRYNTLSKQQVAAFAQIRDGLGITAGGTPVHVDEATNDQHVLPRSGRITETDSVPMVDEIVRRVTRSVLDALGKENPEGN